VESIHNYHLSEGHKGIDYNICVIKNGDVVWGRGLEYEGGHTMNKAGLPTYGVNDRSVGIVCLGNFMKDQMGDAQKEALKRIVADVVRYYHFTSIAQIVTHKEIAGPGYTDCPGLYFPTDEIREYIRQGAPTVQMPENPLLWKVIVDDLNYRETPGGKILGMLHYGDLIYLERYVETEKWSRVHLGGPKGKEVWVWLKYIGE